MRSDIDRLMGNFNLDAIIVLGDKSPNPIRDYLTRRSKTAGIIIKKRDQDAIFITPSGMELEEAARSGLMVRPIFEFGGSELTANYKGDPSGLERARFQQIFQQLGLRGRIGFYGVADVANTLALVTQINVPDAELIFGGDSGNLFSRAYETKDAEEIECLKESGRRACEVVRRTWDFVSQHYASNDTIGSEVVNDKGEPLTIGAVKRFIRMQEFEVGLDNPETPIFAQGRDAGYPHSHGEDNEVLLVGKSIVFDYFPRGLESGYFHDMTRTWCLGQAPLDVQTIYNEVLEIFQRAKESFKVGDEAATYQEMTLDYFEAKGHPTHRSKPGALEGYVHGLGHGLGLNIHESPFLGSNRIGSKLQAGNVFTVEPGLYYPERGFGVRIEDTVYFDASGKLHTITNFPYNLVLPLSKHR